MPFFDCCSTEDWDAADQFVQPRAPAKSANFEEIVAPPAGHRHVVKLLRCSNHTTFEEAYGFALGQDVGRLTISVIGEGLLECRNAKVPFEQRVYPGDRLAEVNGRRKAEDIIAELNEAAAIEMTIERVPLVEVTLQRAEGTPMGLRLDQRTRACVPRSTPEASAAGLVGLTEAVVIVREVVEGGLVARHNRSCPGSAVVAGQRLLEANDLRPQDPGMVSGLGGAETVRLVLRDASRIPELPVLGKSAGPSAS